MGSRKDGMSFNHVRKGETDLSTIGFLKERVAGDPPTSGALFAQVTSKSKPDVGPGSGSTLL